MAKYVRGTIRWDTRDKLARRFYYHFRYQPRGEPPLPPWEKLSPIGRDIWRSTAEEILNGFAVTPEVRIDG